VLNVVRVPGFPSDSNSSAVAFMISLTIASPRPAGPQVHSFHAESELTIIIL
jgi:hypothetical protein